MATMAVRIHARPGGSACVWGQIAAVNSAVRHLSAGSPLPWE